MMPGAERDPRLLASKGWLQAARRDMVGLTLAEQHLQQAVYQSEVLAAHGQILADLVRAQIETNRLLGLLLERR